MSLQTILEARIEALLAKSPEPSSCTSTALAARVLRATNRYITSLIADKPTQRAVLERHEIAQRMPLHTGDTELDEEGLELSRLGALDHAARWPDDVAPRQLASALERTGDPDALLVAAAVRGGNLLESMASKENVELARAVTRWHPIGGAIVLASENQVRLDLMRPFIAIDAGKPHHELVTGWSTLPKKHESMSAQLLEDCRLELINRGDGRAIQLALSIKNKTFPNESLVKCVREWRDWFGLRNWAALQRLFSVEGSRNGHVIWKLSEHLEALGYTQRAREDPEVRKKVVREVELLTELELAVYGPDEKLRLRRGLLTPITKAERQEGESWTLEGMELEIHPLLYEGVREKESQKIGTNWYPAPIELAKIDHRLRPHAIALGLILPMRFRWAWKDGADHVSMRADNLLATGNIRMRPHARAEAWRKLRESLTELKRIGLLGHIVWDGPEDTESTVIRLYAAPWLRDRTIHGLLPVEAFRPTAPANGAELEAWRRSRRWTQLQAAEALKVDARTIGRAERAHDAKLTTALTKAWGAWRDTNS